MLCFMSKKRKSFVKLPLNAFLVSLHLFSCVCEYAPEMGSAVSGPKSGNSPNIQFQEGDSDTI